MDSPHVGTISHGVICDECRQEVLRQLAEVGAKWVRKSVRGKYYVNATSDAHKTEWRRVVWVNELVGTCYRVSWTDEYPTETSYTLCPVHLCLLAQLVAAAAVRHNKKKEKV